MPPDILIRKTERAEVGAVAHGGRQSRPVVLQSRGRAPRFAFDRSSLGGANRERGDKGPYASKAGYNGKLGQKPRRSSGGPKRGVRPLCWKRSCVGRLSEHLNG